MNTEMLHICNFSINLKSCPQKSKKKKKIGLGNQHYWSPTTDQVIIRRLVT